jgi:hypothetical protein
VHNLSRFTKINTHTPNTHTHTPNTYTHSHKHAQTQHNNTTQHHNTHHSLFQFYREEIHTRHSLLVPFQCNIIAVSENKGSGLATLLKNRLDEKKRPDNFSFLSFFYLLVHMSNGGSLLFIVFLVSHMYHCRGVWQHNYY